MIDVGVLRAMAAAGATVEVIISAVEALQTIQLQKLERTRSQTRERVRKYRERRCNALHALHRVTSEIVEQNQSSCNALHALPTPPPSPSSSPPIPPLLTTSSPTPSSLRSDSSSKQLRYSIDEFEQFWRVYPRKVAKKAAEKAYAKAVREVTPLTLLLALQRQIPKWKDPDFIPHPATWLNQGRWNDGEVKPTPARQKEPNHDKLEAHYRAKIERENHERQLLGDRPRPHPAPRSGSGHVGQSAGNGLARVFSFSGIQPLANAGKSEGLEGDHANGMATEF